MSVCPGAEQRIPDTPPSAIVWIRNHETILVHSALEKKKKETIDNSNGREFVFIKGNFTFYSVTPPSQATTTKKPTTKATFDKFAAILAVLSCDMAKTADSMKKQSAPLYIT